MTPRQLVPLTLHWNPGRAHTMAVARFGYRALAAGLPPGWYSQRDHLGYAVPGENQPASTPARTAMRLRSALGS